MNGNSTRRVVVEPGGTGVVAHVGLHALGSFADRLGLGEALSSRIPWSGAGIPLHDRGKVLVQTALMLAGGGESCLDIEHLRIGGELFSSVPSDTTVARTFHEITSSTRSGIAEAMAEIRAEVWSRSSTTTGSDPVVLDIDASLVEIHSENKEQTAPTFKGGFGFHPLFCFADATGETLSALLRPGNAGSNTVADHITVLDDAIAQLPAPIAAGHHEGDQSDLVQRDVIMRADSAGCTQDFLESCRARNVGFYVSARGNAQVTAAIFDAIGIEEVWLPALGPGRRAEGGSSGGRAHHPDRRSEVPVRNPVDHPTVNPSTLGAQRRLFPSLDYRYWGFDTDQDGNPRALDATMRAHAHVESHIQRLKDSGLCRFPFASFEANTTWLMTVALAADLVRWFQLLCFDGSWTDARPKALRWGIFHAPGRLVHRARQSVVRTIDGWPTAQVLLDAYQRIALIT